MRVAYRRMSGAIGLTDLEKGSRGMWLEKRRALLAHLEHRGHEVTIVNRMTKFSQPLTPAVWDAKYDVLFIEFGSSNAQFYGDDLVETQRMVREHQGRIVYLCDDPDLPYVWKTAPVDDRWSVWMNARRGQPFGGQPETIPIFDAPFASLLTEPLEEDIATGEGLPVYIGRPKGREKMFKALLDHGVGFDVAGREAEWKDFPVKVVPAPEQSARPAFYRTRMASLVLSDKKHKKMDWRTGRAYHALYAGTPALVEGEHAVLGETFTPFADPRSLEILFEVWRDPVTRFYAWKAQMERARKDLFIFEATFRAAGL